MVRAIYGVEEFEDFMLDEAYPPVFANDEVIVTTQVIVTCHDSHFLGDLVLCLDTCHPGIYLAILLGTA